MYILTNSDSALGFGLNPGAVVKVVEVGSAALTFGRDLFTGGNFSTTASVLSYVHDSTPPDQKFTSCKKQFQIKAYTPGPLPLQFAKQKSIGENFWFDLSYEYNGNDLRNVAVEPLLDASSTLRKSEFNITFAGDKYSLPRDPVAEVVYHIGGRWKAWNPVPFMDTIVSFSGDLHVRADGSARIENFKSEKGYVWYASMTNNCAIAAPCVPKEPFLKLFWLPILFPLGKHKVSEDCVRIMHEWVSSWPNATREKIARGAITMIIEGFASRPGGELFNLELSELRAESVKNILKKFTGSNTKFDVRSHGKYRQNLPGLLNVVEWLKRFFNPNKYDQAAVIRFEDFK